MSSSFKANKLTCPNFHLRTVAWSELIRIICWFQNTKISMPWESIQTGEKTCNPLKILRGFLTIPTTVSLQNLWSPWSLQTTLWNLTPRKPSKSKNRKSSSPPTFYFSKTNLHRSQNPNGNLTFTSPSQLMWCWSKSEIIWESGQDATTWRNQK